ncbi:MAG: cytochrome C oxidase subunit IV family protein [bacterium]|nr:cytochrome C oxidase subunit IV family protein [bacterium]
MADNAEEIREHIRAYVKVFVALAVLTVVTVAVSYLHIPSIWVAVALALVIALFKGSLVAAVFMHLSSERAIIYWVLLLTVVFFIVLMLLPLLTEMSSVGTPTEGG